MNRLIVCGCSFTYGHGLPDCRYDGVKYTDMNQILTPSEMCWGKLAADSLGMECVNLSRPGESNRYIAYKLCEFEYQPGDIVVPMWTHFSRRSWINPSEISIPLGTWKVQDTDDVGSIQDETDRVSTAFYKFMYNDLDAVFENLVYINFIDFFIRSKGLKIVNTCTRRGSDFREAITSEIVHTTPWNQVHADLIFDDYLDLGTEEDGHPSLAAHQSFAERLVQYINESY